MSAGAYALGERLAGAAGGLAALAAIVILPDASNYGLRNGAFSFHWMVLAAPGATYALGAAFLSLVLLDRWIAERSPGALVASALLAGSMLLFRAHIFLPATFPPGWRPPSSVAQPSAGARRCSPSLPLAGVVIAGAATVLVAHLGEHGFSDTGSAVSRSTGSSPTRTPPRSQPPIRASMPIWQANRAAAPIAAGIVLAFVAALGAFLVLLPAAMALARRRGVAEADRRVSCFPRLLLAAADGVRAGAVAWRPDRTDSPAVRIALRGRSDLDAVPCAEMSCNAGERSSRTGAGRPCSPARCSPCPRSSLAHRAWQPEVPLGPVRSRGAR